MSLPGYPSCLILVGALISSCSGADLVTLFSGMIIFKGSKMIDCPERLYTGADLLVSLSLHILPSAFKRFNPKIDSNPSPSSTKNNFVDKEGVETEEERMLRNRKSSLQNLFKRLDLRPREGSSPSLDVGVDEKENISPDGTPRSSQIICSGSRKGKGLSNGCTHNRQSHDHGHDSEEEGDGEVLTDGDLRVIYKRCV